MRDRLRILVICDRWLDASRVGYDSPHQHATLGSLWAWGGADVDTIYYDVERLAGRKTDDTLADYLALTRPDVICQFPLMPTADHNCASEKKLRECQEAGIKVANFFFDAMTLQRPIRDSFAWSDLNVITDIDLAHAPILADMGNCYETWHPMDVRRFAGDPQDRDIDVSFIGHHHWPRRDYLPLVENFPVVKHIARGQRDTGLSMDGYIEVLKRSKIGLSFDFTSPGKYQRKSRPIEVASAGAMLLGTKNYITDLMFVDGEEYVGFTTPRDMLEKMAHYLAYPEQLKKIAAAGRQRAFGEWGPASYWPKFLERLTA